MNKLCLIRIFSLFTALLLLHLPAYAQNETEDEAVKIEPGTAADTFVPAPSGEPDAFSAPDEALG